MEQALDDSVKALKTYIHNQIAQVRLSILYYISVYYFKLHYIIKLLKIFLSEHCYVLLYNVADLFPFLSRLGFESIYNQSWVFLLTKTLVDLLIVT